MGMGKRILACLALLLLLPLQAQAAPAPVDQMLGDVGNDDGSAIGIFWDWNSEPTGADAFSLEVRVNQELVDHYALTERQSQMLSDAREWLRGEIADLLAERTAAAAEMRTANDALNQGIIDKLDNATINQLRSNYWAKYKVHRRLEQRITSLHEEFASRTYHGEDLRLKALTWEYLKQALAGESWVDATGATPMTEVGTKAGRTDLFGVNAGNAPDAGRKFATVGTISVPNPGTPAADDSYTGLEQFSSIPVNLVPDIEYQVKMSTYEMVPNPENAEESLPELDNQYTLGSATPLSNAFDKSKWNNLLFALFFSSVILTFIILARRNPNMFIRRIAGLEAVDEAIGRATEMGKPVLYLCGMQSLSELPTLAAINILGRVAGKIADYESDLIVPNRDPVVQTVAQEVVKEGYLNAGRPDAYRDDNIFFLTDDQFSFTAATCGIMMRDKPAAIFLMGYYYAESLLLAETGADTGAIQIAGTDAEHQLPFFIVTCDYTLIGEELYAASAYLSREPMLLGSLKGQDVAKAIMMLIILLQAIFFIFGPQADWLKDMVTPL